MLFCSLPLSSQPSLRSLRKTGGPHPATHPHSSPMLFLSEEPEHWLTNQCQTPKYHVLLAEGRHYIVLVMSATIRHCLYNCSGICSKIFGAYPFKSAAHTPWEKYSRKRVHVRSHNIVRWGLEIVLSHVSSSCFDMSPLRAIWISFRLHIFVN